MKLLLIILFLFQYSCNKSLNDDIIIHPSINKKDSLLTLKIKNNTKSNLMIEFPTLENFLYKDELEASTPKVLYVQKSFEIIDDEDDLAIYKNLQCKTVMDLMKSTSNLTPKFIKGNSEKTYYLKIRRYRSGKTILLKDDGLNKLELFDDNKKNAFEKIKIQNCSGYKYYKGSFSFYPDKIVLE